MDDLIPALLVVLGVFVILGLISFGIKAALNAIPNPHVKKVFTIICYIFLLPFMLIPWNIARAGDANQRYSDRLANSRLVILTFALYAFGYFWLYITFFQ